MTKQNIRNIDWAGKTPSQIVNLLSDLSELGNKTAANSSTLSTIKNEISSASIELEKRIMLLTKVQWKKNPIVCEQLINLLELHAELSALDNWLPGSLFEKLNLCIKRVSDSLDVPKVEVKSGPFASNNAIKLLPTSATIDSSPFHIDLCDLHKELNAEHQMNVGQLRYLRMSISEVQANIDSNHCSQTLVSHSIKSIDRILDSKFKLTNINIDQRFNLEPEYRTTLDVVVNTLSFDNSSIAAMVEKNTNKNIIKKTETDSTVKNAMGWFKKIQECYARGNYKEHFINDSLTIFQHRRLYQFETSKSRIAANMAIKMIKQKERTQNSPLSIYLWGDAFYVKKVAKFCKKNQINFKILLPKQLSKIKATIELMRYTDSVKLTVNTKQAKHKPLSLSHKLSTVQQNRLPINTLTQALS